MSNFYIIDADNIKGSPPLPKKQKQGVVSFAYVTTTNDTLSYLQLLGTNTIWVTGLGATDILNLPDDDDIIDLFDEDQILVGCNRQYKLYINAPCTLNATTPNSIKLPVAGIYILELTVISATGVYVSCEHYSGGPEATVGNYIAPLVLPPAAATITAAELIPPYGNGDLILHLTDAAYTLPSASALYTALYGTQTYSSGMNLTCKIFSNSLGDVTLTRNGVDTILTTLSELGTRDVGGTFTTLAANTMYLATFMFTTNAQMYLGGCVIAGGIA